MQTKPDKISADLKATFLEKVASLWPIAKGTLCETRTSCIRKGCKACASGEKHPRFLFTFWENGKQRGLYVRQKHAEQLRKAIANGRELERLMTEHGREFILSLRSDK